MHVRIRLAVTMVMALAPTALAQEPRAPVAVHGLAWDSLRRAPLRHAFVSIQGSGMNTVTDERGYFRFGAVQPGPHVFQLQHVVLDTLGFSGLTARATVTDGVDDVGIAVPSFGTLWHTACARSATPADSGIVYGTVRDATTRQPARGTDVHATWTDSLTVDADVALHPGDYQEWRQSMLTSALLRRAFTRHRWRMDVIADAEGNYTLCGIPVGVVDLRVQAIHDDATSGRIDVPLAEHQVIRRDLAIGAAGSIAPTGTVTGTLADRTDMPFPYARVTVDDVPETRSDSSGRFTLRGVPAGTRQLDVRFVGMVPVTAVVEVIAGDTAMVNLRLEQVHTLDGMTVVGSGLGRVLAREFDARRRRGNGYFVDSTVIAQRPTVASIIREFPSVMMEQKHGNLRLSMPDGRGGQCTPVLSIDGAEADFNNVIDLEPSEVAAVEVHVRSTTSELPLHFVMSEPRCGLILIWTKYGFRER